MNKKNIGLIIGFFLLLYPMLSGEKKIKSEPQVKSLEATAVPTSGLTASPSANITSNNQLFKVTKVVDGDTIKIETGQTVRYIGIDTPESVDPRKPVQCFAREASEKNKELVLGKTVRLEKDISETDRYGRLLRYVYVGDSLINEVLVREGFAHSYSYPPDINYQDKFIEAERQARDENKGLWATCPIPTPTVNKLKNKSAS